MDFENKKAISLLEHTVKLGVNLPQDVFLKRFENYLFFDNDICTSECLIGALNYLIFNSPFEVASAYVYSSSDYNYLGSLNADDNWVSKIFLLSKSMNDDGDYGGLIILDASNDWCLFQRTPVDDGVLGINDDSLLKSEIVNDNFFNYENINEWLSQNTLQDIELVKGSGKDYLESLILNYS